MLFVVWKNWSIVLCVGAGQKKTVLNYMHIPQCVVCGQGLYSHWHVYIFCISVVSVFGHVMFNFKLGKSS